jgi:hypothetical protein
MAANTDVLWPFRQILSSIESMRSAPAFGTSSIQIGAMLRIENARWVHVSASLSMDKTTPFADQGLSWRFGISRQEVESRDDHRFFFAGTDIVQT